MNVDTSLYRCHRRDLHQFYEDHDDAFPRIDVVSNDNPYVRWVMMNHVGHHIVRGTGNYNIVFPGPDYWFGTAFYPSGETAESMQ